MSAICPNIPSDGKANRGEGHGDFHGELYLVKVKVDRIELGLRRKKGKRNSKKKEKEGKRRKKEEKG